MKLILKHGRIEIWEITEAHGTEYAVYGVTESGDPVLCPSLGMAHEVAGCSS